MSSGGVLINHSLIQRSALPAIILMGYNVVSGGTASPISVTMSRSPVAGEAIIIGFVSRTGVTATTPSGFALSQVLIQGTSRNYIFRKIATGAESATFTVSFSSTVNLKQMYVAYVSNPNTVTPFATNQSKSVAGPDSSPVNIHASGFAVTAGQLVICLNQDIGNSRNWISFTNGFLLGFEGGIQQSWLGYKQIPSNDPAFNSQWAWGGGPASFSYNFVIINP